ncbi:hypothetical protein ACFW04_013584 [Cataglyphis niger]
MGKKEEAVCYGNVEEKRKRMKRKREEPVLEKGKGDALKNRKKSGGIKDAELRWIEGEGELMKLMKSWKSEVKELMNEVRGIKGWKKEIRKMKEEVKEEIREQGVRVSEEIEKVRKELRESEKKWKEEREELKNHIKELDGRLGKIENRYIGEGKGNRAVSRGVIGNRLKEMESNMERREREERRRNVLIKGMEVKEGRRRTAVEELFGSIGVKAEIEEVRKIGGDVEGGNDGSKIEK